MKLQDLKPAAGSKRKRQRIGRGEAAGKGRYGGRGIKGQGSRGGKPKGVYFEGGQLSLSRRLPIKRGFNNIFRLPYQEVRLDRLAAVVASGAVVTPSLMQELGLINDRLMPVVILGNGAVDKSITVKAHRFTKSAAEKINAAGGTTHVIPVRLKGARITVRKLRRAELVKLIGE